MKLKVLGSSSSGNCYILTSSKNRSLVVEAGVKTMKIKEALGFDLTTIEGVLLSHAHK